MLSRTSNSIKYFLVLGRVWSVKSTPRRHLWRGTLVSRNLRHYLVDLYWLVSCPLYFDMIIYKYLVLVEFERKSTPDVKQVEELPLLLLVPDED